MLWNTLNSVSEFSLLLDASYHKDILILKHSTRCSISSTALSRIERGWNDTLNQLLTPYYLDLIANRDVSNTISTQLNVKHESPQILIVRNGTCMFHASHLDIDIPTLFDAIKVA